MTPAAVGTPGYPFEATNPSPVYGTPSAVPVNLTGIDVAGPMLEAKLWWATHPGKSMPAMLIAELAKRGGVSSDALAAWAARDPIERVRDFLTRKSAWDEQREAELVAEIDARFREAVSISERTPPPQLESMFEDVYETPPWHLVEQRQQLLSGPRAPSAH